MCIIFNDIYKVKLGVGWVEHWVELDVVIVDRHDPFFSIAPRVLLKSRYLLTVKKLSLRTLQNYIG